MKQLRDYINFYHNAQFLDLGAEPDDNIIKLESITNFSTAYDSDGNDIPFSELKPILRPLSNMTEDEVYEYDEIQSKGESVADTDTKFGEILIGSPECFLWLLSKHFDLFGLIDDGIAIDKSSMIITPNRITAVWRGG